MDDRDVLQVRYNDSLRFKTREAVRDEEVDSQREVAGASLVGVAKISPVNLDMEQCPSLLARIKVCSGLELWVWRASPTAHR